MSARFTIDLLHPGRVARTWRDWFVGTQGRRRLLLATAACGAIILLIWVFQIPTYLRLSKGQGEIPTLRGDLAKREGDLRILRAALQALSVEAKRQVRWAELLTAFSQQIPPTLKITKVEALRPGAPAAGQPPAPGAAPAGAPAEAALKIEAITPLKPGSPNMLEIAQFMAGLLKEPNVNRRFQLKSWEIRSGGPGGGGQDPRSEQALTIVITLSEKGR